MSIDLKYGVPTVCLHTSMFVTVTRSVVRMNGAPRMRQVYLPHPVMGKTPEQIRGYVFGASPVSRRPVMQEVVEGLTQALNDEDRKGLTFERSTPRERRDRVDAATIGARVHLFDVEAEQHAAEQGGLAVADQRQLAVLIVNRWVVATLRMAHEVDLPHGKHLLAEPNATSVAGARRDGNALEPCRRGSERCPAPAQPQSGASTARRWANCSNSGKEFAGPRGCHSRDRQTEFRFG